MLKVISFKICPFVQRITAMLEAKNLSYQVEYISLSDKPQWFMDISPNGQVPVMVTENGIALFESDAIAEYLEDAYPVLQQELSAEQKALNRAWSYLGTKNYLPQCGAQSSKDAQTLKERTEKLATAFAKVEKVLGEYRFFNSDTLSMVDLAWLPLLHRAQIIREKSGYDFLVGYPKVQAWQAALMDTSLAEKTVSEDFLEKFSDFYLSEKTFLGRCKNDCDCSAANLDTGCQESGCCDVEG
ncbi:glutathione S-transferase family protein [Endozoicomonas elysicola]|uniref:Glutathione S-transferase n=1 Tax=Endozoicomonas elysicola TaxID=305900 RepID=A0A081K5T3_9GAMM|nr:glutathione S-transferase family protein [Endozoicomonas elysicola]KEI69509.1 glutathione S-transferase [Endozoicomonas elysicola]